MENLGTTELVILFLVALVVIGGKKYPELFKSKKRFTSKKKVKKVKKKK